MRLTFHPQAQKVLEKQTLSYNLGGKNGTWRILPLIALWERHGLASPSPVLSSGLSDITANKDEFIVSLVFGTEQLCSITLDKQIIYPQGPSPLWRQMRLQANFLVII